MNRRIIIILLVSISFLCFGAATGRFARATEGGGGAYANGAEDFMSGALPPPGTYIVNFFNFYHANKLKDNKGNTSPVDFDLEAVADTVRLVHITKQKVFGADWGMQMLTPFVKVHASTPGGIDSKTGIGDIVIDPFLLGWHFTNWHITAGIDTVIP